MITLEDRKRAVSLIAEARANGARLKPACDILGIKVRTHQRWTKERRVTGDKRITATRPEPQNKLSEEEREEVLETVNSSKYGDLPPSQIVPRLADGGIYIASESSFYRILREEKMLKHRGKSKAPERKIPETHIATGPNQVWTWDITWMARDVKGLFYKLYMILDIFSRKIVGFEVWPEENAKHAERLVKKALLSENTLGRPLVLHSDNGSPMKAATFLATLEKLGVCSSFSRPRVSNDNAYSESLFKTLKYRPVYPEKGFETLEEVREWVRQFVYWYNNIHQHSGIGFITPTSRHNGQGNNIMKKRKKVYEEAKSRHPERWSRDIRDWSLPDSVTLNPTDDEADTDKVKASG